MEEVVVTTKVTVQVDIRIGVVIPPQDIHRAETFHTIINNILHQAVEVLVDTLVALEEPTEEME